MELELFALVTILVCLEYEGVGGVGKCSKYPLSYFRIGETLSEDPFLILTMSSQLKCVVECQTRKRCQSLSYHSDRKCRLFDLTSENGGNLISMVGAEYTLVAPWPHDLMGNCSQNNCPALCIESKMDPKGFICITECGTPPNIINGTIVSTLSPPYWNGTLLIYTCPQGFLKTGGELFCHQNATWSTVSCQPLLSCSDIHHKCVPILGSGDYLVYAKGGNKLLKLYCRLDQPGVVESYLTLPAPNYSTIPGGNIQECFVGSNLCGTTTFDKIFITVPSDTSDYVIIPNSQRYSSKTGCTEITFLRFGQVASCSNNEDCPVNEHGKMHINMTGTGLIVDPASEWKGTEDFDFLKVVKDDDLRIIDIYCNGDCGRCQYKVNIRFLVNVDEDVDTTGVFLPTCV